jgi:hypothetical protein
LCALQPTERRKVVTVRSALVNVAGAVRARRRRQLRSGLDGEQRVPLGLRASLCCRACTVVRADLT